MRYAFNIAIFDTIRCIVPSLGNMMNFEILIPAIKSRQILYTVITSWYSWVITINYKYDTDFGRLRTWAMPSRLDEVVIASGAFTNASSIRAPPLLPCPSLCSLRRWEERVGSTWVIWTVTWRELVTSPTATTSLRDELGYTTVLSVLIYDY